MGFMVTAEILYDNTGTIISTSSFSKPKYQIRFKRSPLSYYNIQVVNKGVQRTRREIIDLNGIRFLFTATGKLGQMDWNYLLLYLSTSFAMFAVTTTIVDFLMLYVLPNSDQYEMWKFQDESGISTIPVPDLFDEIGKLEEPRRVYRMMRMRLH